MAMNQLEYLERLSSEPETLTLQDRIAYLEHCYRTDPISSDTRIQLSERIDALKAKLTAQEST